MELSWASFILPLLLLHTNRHHTSITITGHAYFKGRGMSMKEGSDWKKSRLVLRTTFDS
uniref:Dirigent protein n=1 Tax=Setaria viridis TaxID=4556 RepID=A0A4U6VBX6_SETVI|nr:hypothetical protein SEVIR_3G222850v2 [Setaria viridis]